ncbi:MAG: DNA polymerase III subunit gamma/tau [Candidatus Pacebacteria bacterium]|nr:DNA polymerase III subunit gamma/tau [Candidatus Paceibacterota bacterium]
MTEIISQTLYRKYRPKDFNDIFGQEEVVSSLESSIKNKKIAHAYLFSGGRGSGKTSVARIFAEKIGTKKEDIYEIDAASNRKIDEVRSIRDTIEVLPSFSQYKVYIIDEVHMLTKEASNALLKTLEEPPKHVIFILATTEKEKILDTIKSRCQIFDFKNANLEDSKKLVKKIAKKEEVDIDDKSIEFVAKLGNGSFRDTVSFLQKVISIFNKKIVFEEIDGIFQKNNQKLEDEFLKALNENKKEDSFKIYSEVLKSNIDFNYFLEAILEKVRISLLIRNSVDFEKIYQEKISQEDVDFLKGLKNINSLHLKQILEFYNLVKKTNQPEIAFEIFILELF